GRMHFAESYDGGQGYKGYEAEQTLENATKDDMPSKLLMYYYGALVWEQLKQKVGDEAMLAGFSEFFRENTFKTVTYQEFLVYLQKNTDVQVKEYLSQWLKNNAKIDLCIGNVDIKQVGQHYRTEVEVVVNADRDYELISALGYKSLDQDKLELIEVCFTQAGNHKVVFDSDYRPQFIQIDPAYRVPQINLSNNSWSE
ncbi:MAG: hypothetical protein K9M55_07075, partial [Candidatus Marinimicrobia bacterium]|nr:hypothetical protein [Candidatus Neomarinimicrobiota bacterium]